MCTQLDDDIYIYICLEADVLMKLVTRAITCLDPRAITCFDACA